MIRKIIRIDEEKCNGCGICAAACHEGAIEVIAGKAKLTREDCCDGLGDCLPACPAGAITFEEREAPAYDREAVLAAKGRCSGSRAAAIQREAAPGQTVPAAGLLSQWPVQIKLVPVKAPYFNGAKLLVAADCTAYAYGNFHQEFIRGHITLIGEADPDPCGERHQERNHRPHGSALLRRARERREAGPPGQREVHPMECGDGFHRRTAFGLTGLDN